VRKRRVGTHETVHSGAQAPTYTGRVAGYRHSLQERPAGSTPDTSTNDKPECKEPSNLPFKQILAGASPVRFSNSNVNAKRPEHSDSQSDPIEFDSRHVHQSTPRWRNGRRAGLRDQCRETCQFDSGSRHQLWPCGGTADTLRLERSVFGRAGATPARATNFLCGSKPK
jgi:hypothetical protein